VWAGVLRVDRVGVLDNFFELGGDSILALQIVARAEREGVSVSIGSIFEEHTVRGVLAACGAGPAATPATAPDAGHEPRRRGLTPLQEGMLFHSLIGADEGAYLQQLVWRMAPSVDRERVRRAWNAAIARHDALRSAFSWEEESGGTQWAVLACELPVATLDWTEVPREDRDERLRELLRSDARSGFDIGKPPLMRLTWIDLGDETWLSWTYHHAILDGWSMSLLLAEVDAHYRGEGGGEAAPQFDSFLDWLDRQDQEAGTEFWRDELAGFDGARSLPVLDAALGEAVRHVVRHLDQDLSARLHDTARNHHVTLGTLFQAAWALVLARSCGTRDALFGLVVAGRPPQLRDAERVVGLLMNTVPQRVRVPGQVTLAEWLQQVQRGRTRAASYDWVALSEIQRQAGANRRHPLFRTTLVYENFPAASGAGAGTLFGDTVGLEQHSADGAMLVIVPGESIRLRLSVRDTSLTDHDVEAVLDTLRWILRQLVELPPDAELSAVGVLTPETERHVLSRARGATRVREDVTVVELFARAARRTPDALAVRHDQGTLSFAELDRRSEMLAARLVASGACPGVGVAILLERGPDLLVALLAVLRSGSHYVPLDPAFPADRVDYVMADSGVRVVLTSDELEGRVPAGDRVVLRVGEPTADERASGPSAPRVAAGPRDLAYVIYTSGSTGRPKGVEIEHGALTNFIAWCVESYFADRPGGTAFFTSIAFDAVVPNVYPPLVLGRPVDVVPDGVEVDELARRLAGGSPYAFLKLTPSHLGLLAQQLSDHEARGLAHALVVGAEAFPASVLDDWRALDRDTFILNEYGPTEATVANSAYDVDEGTTSDLLPIGVPIPNTTMYVLDADLRLLPVGAIGEIFIGGDCVARGYHGQPGLTASRFVPDPYGVPGSRLYRTGDLGRLLPSLDVDFVGRSDDQVKVRGYRIEPGEIEAVLVGCAGVDGAHVELRDVEGGQRLVAWLASPDGKVDHARVREHLAETLPTYMHPAHLVTVPAIPLAPHGKIDRAALPLPAHRMPSSGAVEDRSPAGTDRTAIVAEVWRSVLGVDEVGPDDDFFDLGGDSILSVRITSALARRGLRIDLRTFFADPTVRGVAGRAEEVAGPAPEVPAATEGTSAPVERGARSEPVEVPLTPVQAWFFAQRLANPHHYNQWMSFSVARERAADVAGAFVTAVSVHDAFGLRFYDEGDGVWSQTATSPGVTADVVERLDLAARARAHPDRVTRILGSIADKLHRGLDIDSGPLIRAAVVDVGEPDRVRLLVVCHHLAVDGVSWRILVDDLRTALAGGRIHPTPVSFADWASTHRRWAVSDQVRARLPYWRAQSRSVARLLPVKEGRNVSAAVASVRTTLDADLTTEVLRSPAGRWKVRINDVLLTALAAALSGVAESRTLTVALEGHGREDIEGGLDLSRTVGWFTSIYPVGLESPGPDWEASVRRTRAILDAVPDHGLSFGALRYDPEVGLDGDEPEVVFNYLGQFHEVESTDDVLEVTEDVEASPVDPTNSRGHVLSVTCSVTRGVLATRWTYSTDLLERELVERLAAAYDEALREIVLAAGAGAGAGAGGTDEAVTR